MTAPLVAAIEAGGTKFICAIGTHDGNLTETTRIPTTSPAETIDQVITFFTPHARDLAAIGVASFGPVDLRPNSPRYGFITSTPKTAWRDFDIAGSIDRAFKLPIGFDTDVNAAALAETRWGAARGLRNMLYVTVGTGIGGGAMVEGSLLHGMLHPEMGHIRIPHDRQRDPFPGLCPYHGDCLEGLASGRAIEARWGLAPESLAHDSPAWKLEAEYLALACANWICTLSPEMIVLGGGVMQQPNLIDSIRDRARDLLAGYIDLPPMDRFIVAPGLGSRSGVLGALALGCDAAGLGLAPASTNSKL